MDEHILEAQRYFPTYKLPLERSEIGLREYDLAAKALEADQRSLTAAAGIALFVSGAFATLLGSNDPSTFDSRVVQVGLVALYMLSGVFVAVALLLTHYFARLQRSAVHAARKIVVLRRLLGLDYGNIETVLPANTLDGANEPFAIAMFPGWKSLQAIPVLAVALVTAFTQVIVFAAFHEGLDQVVATGSSTPWIAGVLTALLIAIFYRLSLLEDFETLSFLIARMVARFLNVPLKRRTGHVLYRLRLAISEAARLNLNLRQMHSLLVHIEDRGFYCHNGNSVLAVLGAIYRYARFRTKSGGSTILQQLARSNFLERLRPTLRRKIVEWMVAPWLNRTLNKREALDAYLVSVRYSAGVIGLAKAIHYFFPDQPLAAPLPRHRRFILVERLSNITDTFPQARIQKLVNSCKKEGLLEECDAKLLNAAYSELAILGKLDLAEQTPSLV